MITQEDIRRLGAHIDYARSQGASAARISLTRSCDDLVATLDGKVDKITHCEDSSISIALFVDGRFGRFSTNKLEEDAVNGFIRKCCNIVRMLAPDECRELPGRDRVEKNATSGNELGLNDPGYQGITPEDRIHTALEAAISGKAGEENGCRIISEEGEYSDSIYDSVTMDSEGLFCRHTETCYDYGVEVTVEDGNGEKFSAYWWTSSPEKRSFDPSACGMTAFRSAAAKAGAKAVRSGKYNMVIASDVASKVVSPILTALNGYDIQQNSSFLAGALGKKVFSEGFTIVDEARVPGVYGSKLFDSEGVATKDTVIVENGTVRQFFLNTYMANKLGLAPTVEDATHPKILPWPERGLDRDAIIRMCGSGILVTDFNGGNTNQATGDFSFGIEGFLFRNGKILRPVCGMNATGNLNRLWNNLIAAGEDSRKCMSKMIPTLAFSGVDFSGE